KLGFESIPRLEDQPDDGKTNEEKDKRHKQTDANAHIRDLIEAPAKAADQVHDRVEQRHGLPERRKHVERVERTAQERQRRDDEQRNELKLLEALCPKTDNEAKQAER